MWTNKTIWIQPWMIMRIETDTPPRHVFPLASLFFWCVIWCVCDVLFDAHQMFIFPSPDGGTCLFLRELLGDRRGGGGLLFHNLKKSWNSYFNKKNHFLTTLKIFKQQTNCTFHNLKIFLNSILNVINVSPSKKILK